MNNNDFNYYNVGILTFALMLVVVLIAGMSRKEKTKKRQLLLSSMWLYLIALTGAVMARVANQQPGLLMELVLNLGVMFAYVFSVFGSLRLISYLYTDMTDKPVAYLRSNHLLQLMWVVNGFNLAMMLSSPLTHAYFRIIDGNTFVYGPYIWVYDMLLLLQGLLLIIVTMIVHRKNDDSASLRLVMCGILIFAASVCNIVLPRLSLEFPAMSLVFVMLCVGVQGNLEKELERARADAAESRVRLLSGQIHPHFVFNSLAAIQALVAEDPDLAEKAIQDFSDYLRSHLDVMSDARLVPFGDELEHVRRYVSLELADCVTPLEVSYDLETTDFLVPPLTVQPLVENAIRHGIRTREEGGVVKVSTISLDDAIEVRVTDDGQGASSATKRQDQRRQVGIENVRERIERQCGGTLDVKIDTTGTIATLRIPKEVGHEVSRSR